MPSRIVAHGAGDPRCVWVMVGNELVEATPMEDTHLSAAELAQGLGQRFYLKRRGDQWAAIDSHAVTPGTPRWLPSQDAAVMAAIHRGAR